jgi:hypothetical protein
LICCIRVCLFASFRKFFCALLIHLRSIQERPHDTVAPHERNQANILIRQTESSSRSERPEVKIHGNRVILKLVPSFRTVMEMSSRQAAETTLARPRFESTTKESPAFMLLNFSVALIGTPALVTMLGGFPAGSWS